MECKRGGNPIVNYLPELGGSYTRTVTSEKGSKISDIVAQIIETFKICYKSTRGMKIGVQVKFKAKMEFKTFFYSFYPYMEIEIFLAE